VLAAERGGFLVADDERGAHAGNLVGGDADAHAAGADEQAELGLAGGDRLGDGLGEIGIIIRRVFGGRAEIADGQAAFAQERLERFLEFKAAVIRAEREVDDGGAGGFPFWSGSCVVP
jgi:hypothetical protein